MNRRDAQNLVVQRRVLQKVRMARRAAQSMPDARKEIIEVAAQLIDLAAELIVIESDRYRAEKVRKR